MAKSPPDSGVAPQQPQPSLPEQPRNQELWQGRGQELGFGDRLGTSWVGIRPAVPSSCQAPKGHFFVHVSLYNVMCINLHYWGWVGGSRR